VAPHAAVLRPPAGQGCARHGPPRARRAAEQRFGKVPLLTDDEFDAQYRRVYQRARSRGDASAEINLVRALSQSRVG